MNDRTVDCCGSTGNNCKDDDGLQRLATTSAESFMMGSCANDTAIKARGYPTGFTRQNYEDEVETDTPPVAGALPFPCAVN